ncbi:hypothetical protein [Saccharothrix australiensis]|uniref:Uncharacterized protein n=1 Tax=Saccharothrix australiensis TaxID=2072 RepID=A0A495W627_9PSEU|nr:hypothetical protein [Saccharothrix australiensis]RKT56570.1 hypothetical protein C8E97_5273 [Saccharothrix australiensis]
MNAQEQLAHMAQVPLRKKFVIPAADGVGPASIELTLPHVRVTDSDGSVIAITPRQAELVSAALDNITSWFEDVRDIPEDLTEG